MDASGAMYFVSGVAPNSGNSSSETAADDAYKAFLVDPVALAVDGLGSVFVAESKYRNSSGVSSAPRIKKIAPVVSGIPGGYVVSSRTADEAYVFDSTGRHYSTVDTFSKVTKYIFAYNALGHLIKDKIAKKLERDALESKRPVRDPKGINAIVDFLMASKKAPYSEENRIQYPKP